MATMLVGSMIDWAIGPKVLLELVGRRHDVTLESSDLLPKGPLRAMAARREIGRSNRALPRQWQEFHDVPPRGSTPTRGT